MDNFIICKICKNDFSTTTQQLFQHLLSEHNNEYKLCSLCQRYFYSKSDFDNHALLHEAAKKGYIKCVFCPHVCLSNVTSIEHSIRHSREVNRTVTVEVKKSQRVLRQTPEQKQKLDKIEDNFQNGFALASISCQHTPRKTGKNTFKCLDCVKVFPSIQDFLSHKNECTNPFEDQTKPDSKDIVFNTSDDSSVNMSNIFTISDNSANIIQQNESRNTKSEEILADDSSPLKNETSKIPAVKFVVKPKKAVAKTRKNSDSQKYITTDDNPIAEFLKIPAKKSVKSKQRKVDKIQLKVEEPDLPNETISIEDASQIIEICNDNIDNYSGETSDSEHKQMSDCEEVPNYLKEVKTLEMLQCNICNQMFVNDLFFNRHMESHKRYVLQNKYFCNYCNRRFSKVTTLVEHVTRLHKTAKLYKCGICSDVFGKKALFSQHINDVHSSISGKFQFDDDSGLIIFKAKTVEPGVDISESNNVTNVLLTDAIDMTDLSELNGESLEDSECQQMDVSATERDENSENENVTNTLDNQENNVDLIVCQDIDMDAANDSEIENLENTTEYLEDIEFLEYSEEDFQSNLQDDGVASDSDSYEEKKRKKKSKKSRQSKRTAIEDTKKYGKRSKRLLEKRLAKKKSHKTSKKLNDENDVTVKKTTSNVVIRKKSANDVNKENLLNKRKSDKFGHLCHFCSKRFKDSLAFHLHIKSHFQQDSLLCVCGVRLSSKESLQEHKEKYHKKSDSADIVLIKLNETSYKFIQQTSQCTIQGSLKKVDRISENPLTFTKIPECTEYLGDVTLKVIDDDYYDSVNTQLSTQAKTGIIIKRITPEEAMLKMQNTIQMTQCGEGITPLEKPFQLTSTYVCPDFNGDMYKGVTNVKKLTKKIPPSDFTLEYDTYEMPVENDSDLTLLEDYTKKTYAKRVKPMIGDDEQSSAEDVILVSANPLAHLMNTQTIVPNTSKGQKKKTKQVDYAAIIKKNLSNMLNVKSPKKK